MDRTVVIGGDISLNLKIDGDIELDSVVDGENGIVYQYASGDAYEGEYTVTPKVTSQTLPTAHKLMAQDVTVLEIPYFETSNVTGYTVYIGNEV